MGEYPAHHLWLKFQRSTNQNYDCPRFPLTLNVAGVYIGLSSKMSIPNSFIMQYANNCTMNPVLKGGSEYDFVRFWCIPSGISINNRRYHLLKRLCGGAELLHSYWMVRLIEMLINNIMSIDIALSDLWPYIRLCSLTFNIHWHIPICKRFSNQFWKVTRSMHLQLNLYM